MGKVAKTEAFRIPTIDEVVAFIDQKMKDWPSKFCRFYGEKFYNHYSARGWRLSKNILMKDWKACFCSQWQQVQYAEDQKFLDRCFKEPAHKITLDQRARENAGVFKDQETAGQTPAIDRTLDYLDEIMAAFKAGTASDIQLRSACEWLRANKLLRIKQEQIDAIKEQCGNDGDLGKLLAIRQFFKNLYEKGLTIKTYFYSKFQKVKADD
jgi:hypothetical protein